MWDTANDIPVEVVTASYRFLQDITKTIDDGDQADAVVENVLHAVHPDLYKRLLMEMLRGTVSGRRLVKEEAFYQMHTKMIHVIKELRGLTGMRLKESKEAVESGDFVIPATHSLAEVRRFADAIHNTGWKVI